MPAASSVQSAMCPCPKVRGGEGEDGELHGRKEEGLHDMTVSVNGCKGCDITMVKAERVIYISKKIAQHASGEIPTFLLVVFQCLSKD